MKKPCHEAHAIPVVEMINLKHLISSLVETIMCLWSELNSQHWKIGLSFGPVLRSHVLKPPKLELVIWSTQDRKGNHFVARDQCWLSLDLLSIGLLCGR